MASPYAFVQHQRPLVPPCHRLICSHRVERTFRKCFRLLLLLLGGMVGTVVLRTMTIECTPVEQYDAVRGRLKAAEEARWDAENQLVVLREVHTRHELELQRQLAAERGGAPGAVRRIPRVLHQTWKTDALPPELAPYVASWRAMNPDWEMMFWNDTTGLALLERHYPWFHRHLGAFKTGVEKADIVRYFVLYHYGGVYADLSTPSRGG
jgi:mannosyltransferase OCH1-like enzyme